METGTDSYYCALAERELDDCVKAEKRLEYFTQKPNYLVVAACEKHKQNYIETKVAGREWIPQPCCLARETYIYLFIDGLKKIGPAVRRHKHNYTLITPKNTQSFKQDRIQSFVLALPVYGPS